MAKFIGTRKNLSRLNAQEALNVLAADDFDIFSGKSGTLSFDGGTVVFTVGKTLTGATSGHTATIYAITGDVTSGTLLLNGASGAFQDDEVLSDDGGTPGAAVANGTLGVHTGNWTGFTVVEAAVFNALTTGQGVKQNVGTHTFPVSFAMIADLRAVELVSGVIMAHKIDES